MSVARTDPPQPVPRAGAPVVEVRRLRIWYGETEVVRDVSLAVGSGEIVSLLGPSGCGKTTTLRAIAGFIVPDVGAVFLHGRDVTETPPHQRNIGMVFQGYALFPHLSVADNVAYGLRMRKVARAEIAERVARALALVQLGDFAGRRPKQLSGGQQQRVAIARALVIEPAVLLLDEPLSNLDAKLRQEMRVELRRLLKATQVASIFVTHDQEEAMVLSDHIVLMKAGQVEQRGSPREIYQQPGSLFAAAFVGEANFLRGTVKEVSDAGSATLEVAGVALNGIAGAGLERGAAATLVVKRERVRVVDAGAPAPDSAVDAVFELANFVGANLQIHCDFRGQRLVGLMPAATFDAPALAAGTRLRLGWNAADALIFAGGSDAG